MIRLSMIALVCFALRCTLAAPSLDVSTAPIVQAIGSLANLPFQDLQPHKPFPVDSARTLNYLKHFDPLKHFPDEKIHTEVPGGKNVELQVPRQQNSRKEFKSNIMKPPQARMKMDRTRTPTQEEEIKINNILNNYPVGHAYQLTDTPEPVILAAPIFDFEYACGKDKIYGIDGALIKETGCFHWNGPCVEECLVEAYVDCLKGSSKSSKSKKSYDNSNYSRKII
ncbi:hypothetical protein Pst134EA_025925 [Puccinia striiformis f. sp. tritici]|uniref:Secreted protein n=2 Tax=Puccinia striiformis TaxID=27350 RepID=A0A0L0VWK4_9BASI|nr:hypothetical protein Pst134EA_025925 [Puccinia striiformis f. sp. tritici]KAH9451988.1 hypothetical protein Pst134EA_025925 [Puccinia striiformis f. sp. tritici]KAI9615185.1 hypothetical protein H4Q26_011726 [Puccinia striiformis f. sp. tritici PST-130]KNF03562.1 hypothetical protein PSTG_03088 [Puccinia striiformis f. sp. tritici PST-78]POW19441.1 hypothetical protein PSHT_04674 [Puccinia striiformis]